MLQQYISTGYYISYCDADIQPPITGIGVYTGYLNQCDADGKAYYLALQNAAFLRSLTPCSFSGVTTTTTTTTTTAAPEVINQNSGFFYSWTGYFTGEIGKYYDIALWGVDNGYLSGNDTFENNTYFTNVSINDQASRTATVLAVTKDGRVTGFGSNKRGLLNIPSDITDALQVSVGYDHVLLLRSTSGLVTGWGNDQWGALRIISGLSGVKKVCAGVGASMFILASGGNIITGTTFIQSQNITIPKVSGVINLSASPVHFLFSTTGYISGFGLSTISTTLLEKRILNGISYIDAGLHNNQIIFKNGITSGWGTQNVPTPNLNSGVMIEFQSNIGTILNKDQSIYQWVYPKEEDPIIINKPSYIRNNVVAISQGSASTVAIIKRPCVPDNQILTGKNYLWEVTGVDLFDGGINVGDRYVSSGEVVQPCDCFSFFLPIITGENQQYIKTNVPNCNDFGGSHNIYFNSIRIQPPLLNINYSSGINKTGFAATGITTGDFWNRISGYEYTNKPLYYSDESLSSISGGYLVFTTGKDVLLTFTTDNMLKTSISGISSKMRVELNGFNSGTYKMFVYGHGNVSGHYSNIEFYKNGELLGVKNTSSGVNFNQSNWEESVQFVTFTGDLINKDYISFIISGYLNGIQICNIS